MKSESKQNLVYLVRGENGVELVFKKPADVKLLNARQWRVWKGGKSFDYIESIGDNGTRFLYSENYTGTVGVFDMSKKSHLKALHRATLAHRCEQISHELISRIDEVYGERFLRSVASRNERRGRHSGKPMPMPIMVQRYLNTRESVRQSCQLN